MTAVSEAAAERVPPKSLAQKLAEVMAEVGPIRKRGRNTHFNYTYPTEEDVVTAIREKLAVRGVVLLPAVTATRREGKLTTLDMQFTFVDGATNERLTMPWTAAGEDAADKGVWKAITGGVKYFLLKTFLIPTNDDPEATDAKGRRTDRPARPQPDPETNNKIITEAAAKRLGQLIRQHNIDEAWLRKELQRRFKVDSLRDLRVNDCAAVERACQSGEFE